MQEYIRALCNPTSWTEFSYNHSLSSNANGSILDRIEKQTKAALFSECPGLMFIQGDGLTVALAESLLYELAMENSVDGGSVADSGRAILLDSMLQERFTSADLETSADGNVTNYSDEIKRALLLSVCDSEVSKPEQRSDDTPGTAKGDIQYGDSSCDTDSDVGYFIAVARSRNFSDAEAKTVLRNNTTGRRLTDAEFVRALTTTRRIKNLRKTDESAQAEHEPVANEVENDTNSCRNIETDIVNFINEEEDSDSEIVYLKSDSSSDEREITGTLPQATAELQKTDAGRKGDGKSENQDNKRRRRKKKKKSHEEVVRKPCPAIKSSSKADELDLISLPPSETSRQDVYVINDSPIANMVHVIPTSGYLSSGDMQKVLSRKERRRLAGPGNTDGSRSPLKPEFGDKMMPVKSDSQLSHLNRPASDYKQPVLGFPSQSGNEFRKNNSFSSGADVGKAHDADIDAFDRKPEPGAQRPIFGAGPKLRYIVIDGSNVAMQ